MKKNFYIIYLLAIVLVIINAVSFAQTTYTVKKGDTLSLISLKVYGISREWKTIYNANTEILESPNRLALGMKLIIPDLNNKKEIKFQPPSTALKVKSRSIEGRSSREKLIKLADEFNYTWKVVCERDFPPYNYVDDKGNKTGLDTELVTAILNYLKIEFEIINYPWNRVVNSVDTNEADFAYQFVGKPERFEKYCMIGPIRSGITLFAVRKDSKIDNYGTLSDLKKYSIGHVTGYAYTDEFDSAEYLNKQDVIDNNLLVQILVKGRTDLIIGDLNTLSYFAKANGMYEQIRFLPKILKEVPRYIAFPKEKKQQSELFEKGLNAIKASGTYDKIIKKWK
ncbi:MAG: transporter substrate-binding domain-containing protein [Desulfobacterales bacterium]|nr:transporter substrate-binding domain-containing protein [Desulfobacterales bacterium]